MSCCRRYGGWRGVFNNDYLAHTALVVDFLDLTVADCELVGSLSLAGDERGCGHHGGIWARLGE